MMQPVHQRARWLRAVGRAARPAAAAAAVNRSWLRLSEDRTPTHVYAPTREPAMAAFVKVTKMPNVPDINDVQPQSGDKDCVIAAIATVVARPYDEVAHGLGLPFRDDKWDAGDGVQLPRRDRPEKIPDTPARRI